MMREEATKSGRRMETGLVQFEGDWPGIFIRGDDAIAFAGMLERGVSDKSGQIQGGDARMFRDLIELLKLANVTTQ